MAWLMDHRHPSGASPRAVSPTSSSPAPPEIKKQPIHRPFPGCCPIQVAPDPHGTLGGFPSPLHKGNRLKQEGACLRPSVASGRVGLALKQILLLEVEETRTSFLLPQPLHSDLLPASPDLCSLLSLSFLSLQVSGRRCCVILFNLNRSHRFPIVQTKRRLREVTCFTQVTVRKGWGQDSDPGSLTREPPSTSQTTRPCPAVLPSPGQPCCPLL